MFVFVYGTLKRGNRLDYVLNNAEFISDGFLTDVNLYLPNDIFPYPFCVEENEGTGVEGEVYKIDEEILLILDKVEACPQLYNRKTFDIKLNNNDTLNCNVYLLDDNLISNLNLNEFINTLQF